MLLSTTLSKPGLRDQTGEDIISAEFSGDQKSFVFMEKEDLKTLVVKEIVSVFKIKFWHLL